MASSFNPGGIGAPPHTHTPHASATETTARNRVHAGDCGRTPKLETLEKTIENPRNVHRPKCKTQQHRTHAIQTQSGRVQTHNIQLSFYMANVTNSVVAGFHVRLCAWVSVRVSHPDPVEKDAIGPLHTSVAPESSGVAVNESLAVKDASELKATDFTRGLDKSSLHCLPAGEFQGIVLTRIPVVRQFVKETALGYRASKNMRALDFGAGESASQETHED